MRHLNCYVMTFLVIVARAAAMTSLRLEFVLVCLIRRLAESLRSTCDVSTYTSAQLQAIFRRLINGDVESSCRNATPTADVYALVSAAAQLRRRRTLG